MDIQLTIRNYRCFRDPVTISVKRGLIGFLGINNSGKSSLLRFFYECRDIFTQASMRVKRSDYSFLDGDLVSFNTAGSIFDYAEMFWNGNQEDISLTLEVADCVVRKRRQSPLRIALRLERARQQWRVGNILVGKEIYIKSLHGDMEFADQRTVISLGKLGEFRTIDLLKTFESFRDMMYVGAHRNIVDMGTSQGSADEAKYYDIHIGRRFVENWRRLKTGRSKTENILANRVSDDIKRIFEFDTLEINPADDNTTLQINVNKKTYRLPELGSGIAQFIVVLANAAINQPSYILIDEPEVSLHPSLQFDFLESLAGYAKEGVMFATHSLGLALGYSDRPYSVLKKKDGSSSVVAYDAVPRLSEFLGELSYSGYKELGFDKILLVEGPTEVKVLQQ